MKKYNLIASIGVVLVFLGSLLPQKVGDVWYSQYLVLTMLVYLVPVFILWKFNKILSLFILCCAVSSFFVSRLSPRSIILLTQLEALSLISYGISKLKSYTFIKRAFYIVFFLQIGLLLLQALGRDPIFDSIRAPSKDAMVGFMGSADQLGSIQSILSPMVVGLSPWLIVPAILSVAVSKSFVAVCALILSLVVLFKCTFQRYLKYLIVGLAIFGTVYVTKIDTVNKNQFETRWNVWKHTSDSVLGERIIIDRGKGLQEIRGSALWGYGFGNFLTIFPYVPYQNNFNYSDEKFNHAHNDYLESGLFENGLIGLGLLVILIGTFFRSFILSRKSKDLAIYFCCLLAYLVNAGGNFVSQLAVSGLYLAVLYGMYEGERGRLNGETSELA